LILQLQNINFGFTPEKQILKDLTLDFEEKKIYALMGSNGAGKTTLFNIISGFIKPQNGKILFFEKNLTNLQPYKINRQGVGRTFQDLRLITKLTVKENIILAMQQNPTDNWLNAMLPEYFNRSINQKLDSIADEIIKQYFLSEVKTSLASEISFGQQKLLSLACCVANGARLLLIDEAVAGVHPECREKIALLIKQLKEQGTTVLLIEHNTDFIADIADKIFFLHDGEISQYVSIDKMKQDPKVIKAYM
jgi:branched-chain amino acid transport system ATP-binding protein